MVRIKAIPNKIRQQRGLFGIRDPIIRKKQSKQLQLTQATNIESFISQKVLDDVCTAKLVKKRPMSSVVALHKWQARTENFTANIVSTGLLKVKIERKDCNKNNDFSTQLLTLYDEYNLIAQYDNQVKNIPKSKLLYDFDKKSFVENLCNFLTRHESVDCFYIQCKTKDRIRNKEGKKILQDFLKCKYNSYGSKSIIVFYDDRLMDKTYSENIVEKCVQNSL